jgi:hypothetical protein
LTTRLTTRLTARQLRGAHLPQHQPGTSPPV